MVISRINIKHIMKWHDIDGSKERVPPAQASCKGIAPSSSLDSREAPLSNRICTKNLQALTNQIKIAELDSHI